MFISILVLGAWRVKRSKQTKFNVKLEWHYDRENNCKCKKIYYVEEALFAENNFGLPT